MTRSYYCDICQKVITFDCNESTKKCTCSKVFETTAQPSHTLNMRKNAWSATTQVEFSSTTMGEDINRRNKNL